MAKKKSKKNPFENMFGKRPKKGYRFRYVEVEVIDNENFKGFDIGWSASGIGFGHVSVVWGISDHIKNDWPKQYGFHVDTEGMSDKFIQALMKKAAPKIAELIIQTDLKYRSEYVAIEKSK